MLSFWLRLVNAEGRSDEREDLLVVARVLQEAFKETGMECRLVDTGANGAPMVTGILGRERKGKPLLLSGHYDTVFRKGSFGPEPFRIDGGRAYGPGVLDMKGGIVIALYVVKALNHLGFDGNPLKIAFVGDEESGHEGSRTVEELRSFSEGCLFAFNLETGREDGALCVGRKGCADYSLTVRGKASHPGNAFRSGRNAIEEMAHKIIALQALTDADCHHTVSVGVVSGGTVSNVIPDLCTCKLDVRFETKEAFAALDREIRAVVSRPALEGTFSEVTLSEGIMTPYETTDGVRSLFDFVAATAERYALPVPTAVTLGGASDAAYIAETGVPVLCSCGVCGSGNHSFEESADVSSLLRRAELLAAAALEAKLFEKGR